MIKKRRKRRSVDRHRGKPSRPTARSEGIKIEVGTDREGEVDEVRVNQELGLIAKATADWVQDEFGNGCVRPNRVIRNSDGSVRLTDLEAFMDLYDALIQISHKARGRAWDLLAANDPEMQRAGAVIPRGYCSPDKGRATFGLRLVPTQKETVATNGIAQAQ